MAVHQCSESPRPGYKVGLASLNIWACAWPHNSLFWWCRTEWQTTQFSTLSSLPSMIMEEFTKIPGPLAWVPGRLQLSKPPFPSFAKPLWRCSNFDSFKLLKFGCHLLNQRNWAYPNEYTVSSFSHKNFTILYSFAWGAQRIMTDCLFKVTVWQVSRWLL